MFKLTSLQRKTLHEIIFTSDTEGSQINKSAAWALMQLGLVDQDRPGRYFATDDGKEYVSALNSAN